ncbi:MAG: hypothetical protein L6R36_005077 [Xanthoria steineri]|nr:MAG: hypothetical protein L6R36_005077 [Xanthoria steineri]
MDSSRRQTGRIAGTPEVVGLRNMYRESEKRPSSEADQLADARTQIENLEKALAAAETNAHQEEEQRKALRHELTRWQKSAIEFAQSIETIIKDGSKGQRPEFDVNTFDATSADFFLLEPDQVEFVGIHPTELETISIPLTRTQV